MNIFKKIKDFYSVQKFKELDIKEKFLYLFSITVPPLFLFLFFYFYFLPFGYQKEYVLNNEKILLGNIPSYLFFQKNNDPEKGLTYLIFKPFLKVRNPIIDISIEGDYVYLLPKTVNDEDTLNIWDYSTNKFQKEILVNKSEEDFDDYIYGFIDQYTVKDSDIIAFQIDYEPLLSDLTEKENIDPLSFNNQIILKYKNLRVIQNGNSIELRVDEVYDGNLYTYRTAYNFDNNFFDNRHLLTVIYEKSINSNNGFIELVVDKTRVERVIIVSPYNIFSNYDEIKKCEEKVHENLIKDLNQNIISIGQELYRIEIEKSFESEAIEFIDLNRYYQDKYYQYSSDIPKPLSEYYEKTFFNYFKGKIYEIKIGYEYPFKKVKSIENELQNTTPFRIPIVGEIEDIESINLIIRREPLWEKI